MAKYFDGGTLPRCNKVTLSFTDDELHLLFFYYERSLLSREEEAFRSFLRRILLERLDSENQEVDSGSR